MPRSLHHELDSISRSLATLAFQVRAESLAGLGSQNKIAEYVLLPILRRVYSAPNLANTNRLTVNFPGIDLYDEATGLGVQITSEVSAKKVSETIDTLLAGTLPLKQLVIAFAASTTPNSTKKNRDKWSASTKERFNFQPSKDIFAFDRLLLYIQQLTLLEIAEIASELRSLVGGTHVIHLLPHLRRQVEAQLVEEKRSARYIPDIFVETQDTKYHARCFSHPTLFVRHIANWFDRQPFAGLNRLATMSGALPISTPSTEPLSSAITLSEASEAAQTFRGVLEHLNTMLETYGKIARTEGSALAHDATRAHVLAETKYYIEMQASLMKYRVSDRITELGCVSSQLFLLTGPAGQGKTNFLCDFTERFLLRHDVPCAYVTARKLSRIAHNDITEAIRRVLFPAAVTSLDEGLNILATACADQRKPFVLVIDGLNEHPDIRTFAGQLENLLETLVRHPHVRVLMTCRSEFLNQRFGTLLSGPLASGLHISQAHGLQLEEEQFHELVRHYFKFFEVQRNRVSDHVVEFLRRDVLLLRFFCEAYGARNFPTNYEQPIVTNIYRDEIFRRYVGAKLGRAQAAVANDPSGSRPLVRAPETPRVISLIANYMLENCVFTDVPRSVVPTELDAALTALLDEDLVLRHDLEQTASLLSEPAEVLNFTFDEMRDFLLTEHLIVVHAKAAGEFSRLIAGLQPATAQSVEGLQRFLFYASRQPTNQAFFADYRSHPWYTGVYDSEVFAVPPSYLDAEDRRIVHEALTSGGMRAQHFVKQLALCWESSYFSILNLEMLLDYAQSADKSFFADVFAPVFGDSAYGRKSLGLEFCHFAETHILPDFSPEKDSRYDPILRLLLLLLPIGATPTLESPVFNVWHQLVSAHPLFGAKLIQTSLNEGIRWHRAHLWRLLASANSSTEISESFIADAKTDMEDLDSDDVLRREAERFLKRNSTYRSAK